MKNGGNKKKSPSFQVFAVAFIGIEIKNGRLSTFEWTDIVA